jgi:DNA methylase
MSWRIEESDALTLLRELPSEWAQTCVTRPPRDVPPPELIAVLEETRRVLRADGTLWLALPHGGNSQRIIASLKDTAWRRSGRPRTPASGSVALFTKQPAYLHSPRHLPATMVERRPRYAAPHRLGGVWGARHSPRRASCVPASSHDRLLPREVIDWCVLTSTVPQACGVCGAPWQRVPFVADRETEWRRECVHLNGRGRSLVIDPYCGRGNTGLVAQRRGRDFLGIEQNPTLAALARTRLELAGREIAR